MKKALLVMDMQEITVGLNHSAHFQYDSGLLSAVNRIIDVNQNGIVVYIRNIMKQNLLNLFAPFHAYEGSKEAELVSGLHIVSEHIFDKYKGDAFSNPELCEFLKANQVEEVEVIGVDGGGCVALTALGAVKHGYRVTVNTAAVGTMSEQKKTGYFEKLKRAGANIK